MLCWTSIQLSSHHLLRISWSKVTTPINPCVDGVGEVKHHCQIRRAITPQVPLQMILTAFPVQSIFLPKG